MIIVPGSNMSLSPYRIPLEDLPAWNGISLRAPYNHYTLRVFFFFFFCLFVFSRAVPVAHRGSQARGPTGAVAAGLCQGHSKVGSKQHLRPTPQLTAMPGP